MVAPDLEKPKYCPYCGALLPKIHEKSSLETVPYEKCKSCGKTFLTLTIRDMQVIFETASQYVGSLLPTED